ncbi:MAG: hypothetical protein LUG95_05720 [Clostridiales bacterium]|nr:hypothetical protein [Clostridiales bacterium]
MPAAIIEAGRKNDRLCFALCMDCIYDLQYVLRYINKNRLTYSDCDGLTVVYTEASTAVNTATFAERTADTAVT